MLTIKDAEKLKQQRADYYFRNRERLLVKAAQRRQTKGVAPRYDAAQFRQWASEIQTRDSGVYAITVKGSIVYIGSSVRMPARCYQHKRFLVTGKHSNYRLQRAYTEYGLEAIGFEVVEYLKGTCEELLAAEQHYLDTLGADGENGLYNECLKVSFNQRSRQSKFHQLPRGR